MGDGSELESLSTLWRQRVGKSGRKKAAAYNGIEDWPTPFTTAFSSHFGPGVLASMIPVKGYTEKYLEAFRFESFPRK